MILGQHMLGIRTPLRVSLFGGGTDFPSYFENHGSGKVLSFAIDKYIYIFFKQRYDSRVRMAYSVVEEVESTSELKHDIARISLQDYGLNNGVEVHSVADISSHGSGLGSSSAFTVGLLNAISAHTGKSVYSSYTLARDACDIEINRMGKPIGIQDQWACAMGNLNILEFTSGFNASVSRLMVPHTYVESVCSLYYTGKTRKADVILKEQSDNIPASIDYLDYLKSCVDKGAGYLVNQDVQSLGSLLEDSWVAKKSLSTTISNTEIDEMHNLAIESGAIGAKICGAGGGGYLLCVSKPQDKQALSSAMGANGFPELPFTIDKFGTSRVL